MVINQKIYEVKAADLPLSCPRKDDVQWSAHPKVYLSIEQTGKATCPYCNKSYVLVE